MPSGCTSSPRASAPTTAPPGTSSGPPTPSFVSERAALAPTLAAAGAAVEIPMEPHRAAAVVADALARPDLLNDVGARGRAWVRSECAPDAVVKRMDSFYERALAA